MDEKLAKHLCSVRSSEYQRMAFGASLKLVLPPKLQSPRLPKTDLDDIPPMPEIIRGFDHLSRAEIEGSAESEGKRDLVRLLKRECWKGWRSPGQNDRVRKRRLKTLRQKFLAHMRGLDDALFSSEKVSRVKGMRWFENTVREHLNAG